MTLLTRRAGAALGVALALLLSSTACGGDDEPSTSGKDPATVMAEAKAQFDDAASVHFTMSTGSSPSSGDAVLGADGTLTHQPAFEGDVTVVLSGFNAAVPIVAVDGKVYAKLPLTTGFAPIDPDEYGAPDPADFADPASGISSLLLELEGLKEGKAVRDGKNVLSTYTGTIPGDKVKPIIPSADASGDYDLVIGISGNGRIATLKVTGDFFSGEGDVTYDLAFDDYGKNVTISAP